MLYQIFPDPYRADIKFYSAISIIIAGVHFWIVSCCLLFQGEDFAPIYFSFFFLLACCSLQACSSLLMWTYVSRRLRHSFFTALCSNNSLKAFHKKETCAGNLDNGQKFRSWCAKALNLCSQVLPSGGQTVSGGCYSSTLMPDALE